VRLGPIAGVALFATLSLPLCLAQQPEDPPFQELLTHLQANLTTYIQTVPSFFCDEHVDSVMEQPGGGKVTTTTDSVFRLKRTGEGNSTQLAESREVKTVNKKAAHGEDITGPAIFRGAFSHGAAVVSLELQSCFDYEHAPSVKIDGVNAIVLKYTALPDAALNRNCPKILEGRAYIDPRDLHLLRVEARIPNHQITRGVLGLWTWSIDYAPVVFDGKIFWMPKTIESRAVPNDHLTAWSFVAKYSKYHKLTVTSHIITDVGSNPPPPPE
jgi:hypothetical protein